jgi:hypothetical protein
MNARIISSVAAGGVLALVVSCSQDQSRGVPVPTEASYGKSTTPTCSFSTANNDAKAYFLAQKDGVYALLDAMQEAYRIGGASAAATKLAGMNVLARLGTAAQNGTNQVKGTPTQGNTFANDVLLCMGVAAIDFTAALGPTGLFAVRDNSTAYAVVAHKFGTDGKPLSGAPLYGAEPSTGNWPLAQKTLFHGFLETTATSLADETPSGVVFDLKTLPADLTFAPEIRAGVCDVADATARILHLHGAAATILPPAGSPGFCTVQPPLTVSRSGFRSMMEVATSWFTPQPLFAMPTFGGGGGLVTGLSEIGPVTYTSVVSFTVPPTNTSLSASPQFPNTVTVTDTTANGNPFKHVLITLTVVGNSGSFTNPPVGSTAYTNDFGIATFPTLFIDKAGGYTVTATSEVGGSAQATFQISGQ